MVIKKSDNYKKIFTYSRVMGQVYPELIQVLPPVVRIPGSVMVQGGPVVVPVGLQWSMIQGWFQFWTIWYVDFGSRGLAWSGSGLGRSGSRLV